MTSETDMKNVESEFQDIDSRGAWALLYQDIRNECSNYEFTVQEARKTQNRNLNRYRDVSPYDHSRVVLSKGPCDYINANLVVMEKANRKYILTQGPLAHTTGHFWLMVWEQNCKAVLMLNRIVEKKQIKCHQYWPRGTKAGIDDEMVLTDVGLKVQYISEEGASYYTTRVLRLTDLESGNNRDILHFHYTTWPDFGVPQSPIAFLNFLLVVRKSGVLSPDVGPPVVHCSAGIGRSGTFCLVDSCLVLIEKYGLVAVNVREILLEMRKFRMGLIQTPDQLRFSYLAIIEGAKKLANKNMDNNIFETFEFDTNINSSQPESNSYSLEKEIEGEEDGDDDDEDDVIDEDDDDDDDSDSETNSEDPPPLPPPRGESLKISLAAGDCNCIDNKEIVENNVGLPPDKPLPVEPDNSPSLEKSSDVNFSKYSSDSSKDQSPSENERDLERFNLRQRKQMERQERRERLTSKVQEIKRKQEASESWQEWKRSIFTPVNIGMGVGILLIGGGVFAYIYYSNKI